MEIKTKKWIDKHFDGDIAKKNIVVTGANSGIGFEFCRDALYKDANIYMAVRSLIKGERAKEELLKEFPKAQIDLLHLDVSSIDSINNFVSKIINNKIDIDVFFLNAGVFNLDEEIIDDKYEKTFLTNYLSDYFLLNALLPYFDSLNHEVRIILQSSITSLIAKTKKDDYQSINSFSKFRAYSNTKLYVAQLHSYLVEHNQNPKIKILLTHPGATYTPLIEKGYKTKIFKGASKGFMKVFFHSPSKASLSSFVLLNREIQNGDFYGPRGFLHLSGYPKKTNICKTKRKKYAGIISYSEKMSKKSN